MLSKIDEQNRMQAVEIYLADALRIITENTAKFAGGSFLKAPLSDFLKPAEKKSTQAEETRTGEEIAEDIIGRLSKL